MLVATSKRNLNENDHLFTMCCKSYNVLNFRSSNLCNQNFYFPQCFLSHNHTLTLKIFKDKGVLEHLRRINQALTLAFNLLLQQTINKPINILTLKFNIQKTDYCRNHCNANKLNRPVTLKYCHKIGPTKHTNIQNFGFKTASNCIQMFPSISR